MSGICKPPVGAQLNRSHPLAAGLVGCWLFNEGAGKKAHDYSGNGNTGTLTGMADPPTATSGWVSGPHGAALAFDRSTSNYVNCGAGNAVNLSGAFSIVAWFKTGFAGNQVLLGRDYTKSYYINIAGGNISFFTNNSSVTVLEIYNDSLLHQCVAVMNGLSKKVFVDSYLRISGSGTLVSDTAELWIGSSPANPTAYFNGLISSVSIYNRALSAEEIAHLYAFPHCMFDYGEMPDWLTVDALTPPGSWIDGMYVESEMGENVTYLKKLGSQEVCKTVVKTRTYTLTNIDQIIICNSQTAITINLLAATGSGKFYKIKNANLGIVTVDGNGTETIDGSETQAVTQWESLTVVDYAIGKWVIV